MDENFISLFKKSKLPPQSEDCLFLNIWTPTTSSKENLPVMFYCHGGAFIMGAGSDKMYNGMGLSKKGNVVVITVNHRLGPFGFLHLGDFDKKYATSGNLGIFDLVTALQWVKENINVFGGNPSNVTIFGESGGGYKVSALLAMPKAKNLFHKAIIQSGPGISMKTRKQAKKDATTILKYLGLHPQEIAQIESIPTKELLQAQEKAMKKDRNFMLGPFIDGVILPTPPFKNQAPELSADKPLIIGTNKDEATLFFGNFPFLGTYSKKRLLSNIVLKIVTRVMLGKNAKEIVAKYKETRPKANPNEIYLAITTDWIMRIGSIRIAEKKTVQNKAPVFMYLFSWETPALNGKLKATHSLEIPFIFDNLEYAKNLIVNIDEAKILSNQMIQAWTSFAKISVPTANGLPKWIPYTLKNRKTMIFNNNSYLENDPFGEERLIWEGKEIRET